jgi:hypothetical protein
LKAAHNPPLKFVPAFGLHGTAKARSPLAPRCAPRTDYSVAFNGLADRTICLT